MRDERGTATSSGVISPISKGEGSGAPDGLQVLFECDGSAFEVLPEAVGEFSAEFVAHAPGGAFDFFYELVKVAAGTRDGDNTQGGGAPGYSFVHFGDGDVEALAELVLHRADDVTAVFERVGVLNAEFEREMGDGHGFAALGDGQRKESLGLSLRGDSF